MWGVVAGRTKRIILSDTLKPQEFQQNEAKLVEEDIKNRIIFGNNRHPKLCQGRLLHVPQSDKMILDLNIWRLSLFVALSNIF